MHREGIIHHGIELCFKGARHRIDVHALTGGKEGMDSGETDLTRVLLDARAAQGLKTVYEATNVRVHDFDTEHPRVTYDRDGSTHEVVCDFIAGCDGFHGVCRASAPQDSLRTYERVYPFGWLGILADTPPVS